ncbi:galactose-1-phosphate uridylyltransferase [Candidatus Woesearchaeota archaeon]|nr:galactose-1-phosphate uridylyltransferase [Candidatus Woesearchaeota archaeon]
MEQRKDYILNRWVFLATERKKRPREFKKKEIKEKVKTCFFCPGSENLTPPEIGRVEKKGKWKIRWFRNKFPAVKPEGNPVIRTDNDFFTFSSAYGCHEVIVECAEHDKQLWDLSRKHIEDILKVYKERITCLIKEKNIRYVIVFKNHGREAGTSLVHSHTQVVSLNKVPKLVEEEVNASERYETCPYCRIIGIEKKSDRRCFENDSFVAFTPYASRFNFEIWVFPKRHIRVIDELKEREFSDLAGILKRILAKLKKINASYNLFIHYSPDGKDLHFHIEITPRFAVWAGFEFSSDEIINSVSPEDAAKFYRGEGS